MSSRPSTCSIWPDFNAGKKSLQINFFAVENFVPKNEDEQMCLWSIGWAREFN
jgi:hypothetical protein